MVGYDSVPLSLKQRIPSAAKRKPTCRGPPHKLETHSFSLFFLVAHTVLIICLDSTWSVHDIVKILIYSHTTENKSAAGIA